MHGLEQQKLAVQSGYWPLMRYNPGLREEGKNPFQLDSKAPSIRLKDYAYREARYTMLARGNPGAGGGAAQRSAGRCGAAVAGLLGARDHAGARRDAEHRAR